MNQIIQSRDWAPGFWNPNTGFGSVLKDFFPELNGAAEAGSITPAIDIREHDSEYVVTADLPGIAKQDLDVTIKDGVLTVNAETVSENTEKSDGRVLRQERRVGRFVRSFRVGSAVEDANISADYKDGVLTVVLPKKEAVTPRKIEISA